MTQQIWTDQAFMALPDDGHRFELVNGELVDMGNAGMEPEPDRLFRSEGSLGRRSVDNQQQVCLLDHT